MFPANNEIQDYFLREQVRVWSINVCSPSQPPQRSCNDMVTGAQLLGFMTGVGRGGIKSRRQASIMRASCQGPPGSMAVGKNRRKALSVRFYLPMEN